MTLRLVAVLAVVPVAVLVGCASGGGAESREPSTSAPSPVVTVPTHAPEPATSDVAGVFIAALGGPVSPEDRDGGYTYIVDHTVCSSMLHQQPCPPALIPPDVQDAVVAALGPHVVFTADPPTDLQPGRRVVITLGPARIDGESAAVTVENQCGPLCGLGETLQLHKRGEEWVRTGNDGPSWIS